MTSRGVAVGLALAFVIALGGPLSNARAQGLTGADGRRGPADVTRATRVPSL